VLIPPPQLGEELWARVRRRWRKGQVVTIRRKTLELALLRPMAECPLTKEVTVGWAYVATDHELRRERPTDGLAMEWQTAVSQDEAAGALRSVREFASKPPDTDQRAA
jgi:hypothetical protein